MGRSSELDALLRQIRAAGLTVVQAKTKHWKVYRGKQLITTIASTPSDVRGVRNARAILRRAGMEVDR